MSPIGVDNPQKWLLVEITKYLSDEQLAELMRAYQLQSKRYYHAVKLRDARRHVTMYEKWPEARDTTRLARWRAKLAALQAEWDAMEGTDG